MSAWRWLKGQAVCLAVMPYLLGGNVYSLGVQKYGCAELYLMAKAIGANASMEGLLAVFPNSEAAFAASLMPMVTEILSRDLSVLLP